MIRKPPPQKPLLSAAKVHSFLKKRISFTQEEFWVLALDPGLRLIDARCLFRGTVDQCPVHPRDIFRYGCAMNATRLILSHSHPSGDPTPSVEDSRVTKDIVFLGEVMKIPIEDHVIVSSKKYFSFREKGWIEIYLERAVARFSKT